MKKSETPHSKLSDEQIESILDKLVPLIASPSDHEYFRGVLRIKAEESTAPQFANFVGNLLKFAEEKSKQQVAQ